MGEFYKYPHIDGMHKVPEIFACEEIIATEKVHGTNFGVMVPAEATGGVPVLFGSRNNAVGLGSGFYGDKPIRLFLERSHVDGRSKADMVWLAAKECFPGADVILYGEVFGSGIQSGVQYVTGDRVEFVAFDVCVGGRMVDYDEFRVFCERAGIETAPVLYRGKPSIEAINGLLERNSIVGARNGVTLEKNISEGVVIRPTKMRKNHHDQWVLAKHKSVGFAESSQGKRGPVVPRLPNPALAIADEYVTRGRLLNALDKAKETGRTIANSMSDMQVLPGIVIEDVLLDMPATQVICVDEKSLRSAITRQTAIVYKALLNEQIGQAAE
jgi:Rnl2 family RNA ligase